MDELTKLTKKIERYAKSQTSLRVALSTTLAIHKPRIFQFGLDASRNKIGTYSTKPTYISAGRQARQTGKTKFVGGYAEYKRDVGKNPGYVILRDTDQMYADYGIVFTGNFGFGFKNKHNFEKSQWMEEKYRKKIFGLAKNEINVLAKTLVKNLIKAL